MLELKSSTQSPTDILKDRVYSAMETGNPAAARVALAEVVDNEMILHVVPNLKREVLHTYGVAL